MWELWRCKLAAKFPTPNPRVFCEVGPVAKLHRVLCTTTFLGVSAKSTTQNPGAAAKCTTANLRWHETPPPPLHMEHRPQGPP